jgi:hypothetical protein
MQRYCKHAFATIEEAVFSLGPPQGYITRISSSQNYNPLLFIIEEDQRRKKKHKGLDIQQIYGHRSHRGPMPGVIVPADCR